MCHRLFFGFVMKVLAWAIRIVLFLFLLIFAVQNTESVNLRFVLGYVWQAPLVILLLAFFAAGALLGMLAVLGHVFSARREIAVLQKQLAERPAPATDPLPPPVAGL